MRGPIDPRRHRAPVRPREVVVECLAVKCREPDLSRRRISIPKPLHSYGLYLLLAVRLRSWLTNEFGAGCSFCDHRGCAL
ncbi:hypothetical protein BJX66DRAFT_303432 [Aspergillus keveii]|uniref:Uncharacterized protein n=1 Tax=Aspergillus keveii TaxID=714993 RepID=A0ABR4G6A8_9EURO